jgi:hypothetical protein
LSRSSAPYDPYRPSIENIDSWQCMSGMESYY